MWHRINHPPPNHYRAFPPFLLLAQRTLHEGRKDLQLCTLPTELFQQKSTRNVRRQLVGDRVQNGVCLTAAADIKCENVSLSAAFLSFGRNKVGRSFSFGFAAMGPFFGQKWQWYCSFNYKIVVPLRYVMPKIEHFLHFYQHSQSSRKKIVCGNLCRFVRLHKEKCA